MSDWISVLDRVPELTEVQRHGHILDEYNGGDINTFGDFVLDGSYPRSKDVEVAEQKGDGFEEDIGYLTNTGWATNCDNVTHWKE